MTTKLYIDHTCDIEILLEEETDFQDAQSMRGHDIDADWSETCGMCQRREDGEILQGNGTLTSSH